MLYILLASDSRKNQFPIAGQSLIEAIYGVNGDYNILVP